MEEHRVPIGSIKAIGQAFWRRSQEHLLAPYAEKYLELLPTLHTNGMIPALSMSGSMFPRAMGTQEFVDRAIAAASEPAVSPVVRNGAIEAADRLQRRLRARQL
jgi:aminopeptidase N